MSPELKFALRAQRIPPKVCVLRPADERKDEGEGNHPDSEVRPHKQLSVVHSVLDRPRRAGTFQLFHCSLGHEMAGGHLSRLVVCGQVGRISTLGKDEIAEASCTWNEQ